MYANYTTGNYFKIFLFVNSFFILEIHFRICGRELRVDVASNIACNLGGKGRTICVEAVTGVEKPNFRNAGGSICFEVPPSYAV